MWSTSVTGLTDVKLLCGLACRATCWAHCSCATELRPTREHVRWLLRLRIFVFLDTDAR